MWLWGIFDFVKANKWAQIALITLATIATLGTYLALRDSGVRKRARAQQEVERARERALVAEARNKIQEARTNAVEHAEQVADAHVVSGTVAELRKSDPTLATIVYGHPRAGSGQAEGQ